MGFFGKSESVKAVDKVVKSLTAFQAFLKTNSNFNYWDSCAIRNGTRDIIKVLNEQIKLQLSKNKKLAGNLCEYIEKLERYTHTLVRPGDLTGELEKPFTDNDSARLKAAEQAVQRAATNLKIKIKAEGLWS